MESHGGIDRPVKELEENGVEVDVTRQIKRNVWHWFEHTEKMESGTLVEKVYRSEMAERDLE